MKFTSLCFPLPLYYSLFQLFLYYYNNYYYNNYNTLSLFNYYYFQYYIVILFCNSTKLFFLLQILFYLNFSLWNFSCFFLLCYQPAYRIPATLHIVFLYLCLSSFCCASFPLVYSIPLEERYLFLFGSLTQFAGGCRVSKTHLFPHWFQGCDFISNSAVLKLCEMALIGGEEGSTGAYNFCKQSALPQYWIIQAQFTTCL